MKLVLKEPLFGQVILQEVTSFFRITTAPVKIERELCSIIYLCIYFCFGCLCSIIVCICYLSAIKKKKKASVSRNNGFNECSVLVLVGCLALKH